MRGGWIATIVVLSLLLFATATCGEEESLFLNGKTIQLESPVVVEDGETLVPLREFGHLVGVEAVDGPKGAMTLRWRDGRRNVETVSLPVFDGLTYAALEWLVDLSGGSVRRLGRTTYVETRPAVLDELDVSEERVVLRFDAFAPVEVITIGMELLSLRFHHCVASFTQRSVVLAAGPMLRVDARSTTTGGVDLIVALREIGALRIERFETAGFYSVTVGVGAEPHAESVSEISENVRLHEAELALSSGSALLAYVRIENWRAGFRVRPAHALSGLGDVVALDQIVRAHAAVAGIAVGEELGLLVVDGVPMNLSESAVDVLAIDAFGRLSGIRTAGSSLLSVEGIDIPLDDVNRPLHYGEAIAYPPGYDGEMARGVPGALTVLKLRSERVVSVYHGTFVDRDPTATLIVASGDACARFSAISLGAAARLVCPAGTIDGRDELLENAVTIESVLVRDGVDLQAEGGRETIFARAWSLIATDWHGALILLTIARDDRSAGATLDDVRSFLRTLPVPIRDAFILNSGGPSALVLSDGGVHELGGGDRTAVGLLLVPIAE